MRLFGFEVHKAEKRSNSVSDPQFWVNTAFARNTGEVPPDQAMRITAVQACVKVIAETVASLPLFLYERKADGGKEIVKDHKTYQYLKRLPNINFTEFELREYQAAMLCLRGNHYAQIVKSMRGDVIQVVPLNPAYMTVEMVKGSLLYTYKDPRTKERTWFESDIWHIKDMPDLNNYGLTGMSRIAQASNAIQLAQSAEDYGKKFFENDTTIGMSFQTPGKLSENARKHLKESLEAFKTNRRHDAILLEEGLSVGRIGLSNEDSQFIESRHLQIEEIARIFRVPCVLIGYPDKASTYASVEQFMLSFIVHTIRPWCIRIEQSMNKTLLSVAEQEKYFFEHKLEGMLRGDMAARFSAYSIAKASRLMTTNEIRALENLNPIDGEDGLDETPNMIPAGKDKSNNEDKDDGKKDL